MRIISGSLRGRKLLSFENKLIRPTSDRARETIFNTITSVLKKKKLSFPNMSVLDCFCGSGALGIESISRGVKKVFFVDKSIEAINLTKLNCQKLEIEEYCTFLNKSFDDSALKDLKVDLFFLDPPYGKFQLKNLLSKVIESNLIKSKSIGVVELPKQKMLDEIRNFKIISEKRISNSILLFIEKN